MADFDLDEMLDMEEQLEAQQGPPVPPPAQRPAVE
ncbi:hypothetical protein KIPB_014809, partial [Kipferlia bialata]|eukprot:g14809.t1